MLSLALLRLRLLDPVRNRDRAYEVEIDRDLFGAVTVTVRFGRHGTRLRDVVYVAADRAEADRIARGTLARRLTARRRLGSAYVLTAAEGDCRGLVGRWQASGGADGRLKPGRVAQPPRGRPAAVPEPLPLFAA